MNRTQSTGPALRLFTLAAAALLSAACSPGATGTGPTAVATPMPQLSGQALDAGTYLVGTLDPLVVTVTVPEGWQAVDDWAIVGPQGSGANENEDSSDGAGMAISFWGVENVYADPEQPELGLLDPPVGPTVEDLAEALLRQPRWAGVSGPTNVTLDGYTGQQVELTGPSDVEFAECSGFVIWYATGDGGKRCLEGPNQTNTVVILDVEGERLVIDRQHFPRTFAANLAELEQVFESIQIERPE